MRSSMTNLNNIPMPLRDISEGNEYLREVLEKNELTYLMDIKTPTMGRYKQTNGPSCSINEVDKSQVRKRGLSEHSSAGCNCPAFREDVQDIKNRLYRLESSMKEDMTLILGLLRCKTKSTQSILPDRTDETDTGDLHVADSCTDVFYESNLATSSKV